MKMRRSDREMERDEALKFLEVGEVGYLALSNGKEPYIVPLNYLVFKDQIFFHCANEGRKLEILKSNARYCFAVSQMDGIKTGPAACDYGTYFHSVLAFGQARVVTEEKEKIDILTRITEKHCPPGTSFTPVTTERAAGTTVVALSIEQLSGKARLRS